MAKIFDYKKWNSRIDNDSNTYQGAYPYPHIVFDEFLEHRAAKKVLEVFPKITDSGWIHYLHYNEKKHGLNKLEFIPKFIAQDLLGELNSPRFIAYLERLTGITNLLPDPSFEGGGIHQSEAGGFLNIHADFTVHPHNYSWRRRVNVLVYLNEAWEESYGGQLELWDKNMTECVVKIAPYFNRIVIFNTDRYSYHGVPEPLCCPEGRTRKSIALYYYTEEEKGTFKKRATNYRARPTDGGKSFFIWVDKKAIAIYSRLKGILGINDDFASKILRKFNRNKK